tara:strand:+ start:339 stop:533 length:195 start_codon:yes stop_codon:yes gene_type:complete
VYYRDRNTNGVKIMVKVYDLGNNEEARVGVFANEDGTFTAMTFTKSKEFKTKNGAMKWLARRMR